MGPRPRMHPPPATMRAALLASALAALAFGACAKPPATEVVLRLDAASFAIPGATRAVEPIGEEARPVVVAPRVVRVAEALAVPLEAGRGRASVTLDADSATLPDSALAVSFQVIPEALRAVPDGPRQYAAAQPFQQWSGAFRLVRNASDPARVALEVTADDLPAATTVNLRLDRILPIPERLESLPFATPKGGHLELAYGLARRGNSDTRNTARFVATLACDGSRDVVLLDRIVQGGEPGAQVWQDAAHALPDATSCRLALEVRGTAAGTARGAVWGVPVVTSPAERQASPVRNVVLISLDTLRADHLSSWGYPRRTSPRIDADLVARGAAFRDVSTTFPRTDVAHASLFTGLYPAAQAVPGRIDADGGVRMLTEALRDSGRTTAAFTEDAFVAGSFGFWFGFDRFVERSFVEHGRGVRTFADGARWAAAHRDRPFFLFLHTYKTHDPYVSGERFQTLFRGESARETRADRLVPEANRAELDAYDRTIREADELVGEFLDELRRSGLDESTLVVLLSDHGEAFGEHGISRHGTGFQQEQLHVPLVLRGPGVAAGRTIDTPASLVDVAPTVLELVGLPQLPLGMGTSLAPGLRGEALDGERPLFFSWLGNDPLGVRRGPRKIVRAGGRYEEFDLATDPLETRRLAVGDDSRAAVEQLMAAHLAAANEIRARTLPAPSADGSAPIPHRVEESLRALGYL